jgi:hypothetical protein
MRFVIVKSENIVVIDNAPITVDLTAMTPANIEMVVYQEVEGKLQYNDRPSVRDHFTDPSPYQPQINAWMTAYNDATPPLTLTQAKFVKQEFVEAIFHSSRRAPFVSSGHTYDARDEAIEYLTATLVANGVQGQINTIISGVNGMVSVNNTSAGNVNNWSAANATNWGYLQHGFYGGVGPGLDTVVTSFSTSSPPVPFPAVGSGGFGNMSAISAVAPLIPWQPLDASAILNISAADLILALKGLVTRRNNLNATRISKKSDIGALTTIAQVIAYDATTGWPAGLLLDQSDDPPTVH